MKEGERALLIAVIGASATIFVALYGALAAYLSVRRDRRRALYGEATRAAVAWNEQLYRVRRRREGDEASLVEHFHHVQGEIAHYQAWIGSDSRFMKRSFDRLVRESKRATQSLINEAWEHPIRPLPGNASSSDEHPDLDDLAAAFQRDVRGHLSPQPWRKMAVVWRNRGKAK